MAVALLALFLAPALPAAEMVFVNGGVYLPSTGETAEALVADGGKIVYVGDNAGARALADEDSYLIDLTGRMLMPGFHDGHAHVMAAGLSLSGCDLEDTRDLEWIDRRLRACATSGRYPKGTWVRGNRWALAAFTDGNPSRRTLDAAFPDNPAYFVDSFGHSAWVNTRALQIAGINNDTPDPPNGLIERDPETGEATGTLRDSAMELVVSHMPEITTGELTTALRAGLAEVARFGITSYVEPGLTRQHLDVYAAADREGWLTARVLASQSPIGWYADRFDDGIFDMVETRDRYRGKYLRADSVKVYLDGVIETRTSFMLHPYERGGAENFPPFYETAELKRIYARLDAADVQVHTHAIGDGAIRLALDAYEHTLKVNGDRDNRHQIVHLQLIDEADIPRFGELGVGADFQALWAYPDDYIDVAREIVGDRTDSFYPIASVQKSGGRIVGGSDWDVSSLNPLDAIETGVRRQDAFADGGPVLNKAERVDLPTMLRAYTTNGAWVLRHDHETGYLRPGYRADLVMLDRDLLSVPVTQINDARVLLTVMDGRVVYEAE